jgi:hypothetical protein
MAERVSLRGIADANHDEAYERVLPEAIQLTSAQVRGINLDIDKAIALAMAVAKRIAPFESRLRTLTEFPVERLDALADYTLALYSAHLRYKYATSRTEVLPALSEAAHRWRSILLAEAKSLVERELIPAEHLDALIGHQGFRCVARDLGGLVQIFKVNWERIKDDTGLKRAKVDEVGQLALKLTGAIATRKRTPEEIQAAKDIRERVFTLFSGAYDTIRRAIQYLRGARHDADELVPSLYSGRRRAKVVQQDATERVELPTHDSTSASDAIEASDAALAQGPSSPAPFSGPCLPMYLSEPLLPMDDSTPRLSQRVQAGTAECASTTASVRGRRIVERDSTKRRKVTKYRGFSSGGLSRMPLDTLSALVRPSPMRNTELTGAHDARVEDFTARPPSMPRAAPSPFLGLEPPSESTEIVRGPSA